MACYTSPTKVHVDSMASLILQYTPGFTPRHGSCSCTLKPQPTSFLLFVVLRQGCIQRSKTASPIATFQPSMECPADRVMKDPIFLTLLVDCSCDCSPTRSDCNTFVIRAACNSDDALVDAQDGFNMDQTRSIPLRLPGQ